MSQRWYTYSGVFIPGTRARAEDVANEFTTVQNAIANIDTYGVDSGTANAYVITTDTVPWTSYAEPRVITFKALNGNTAASTININSIGAVGLKRFNGQALQSGDVLAGHWYTASYNSTTDVFEITSPAQATSAGTISYAEPTGKATLTASLGTLTTVAPSDSNIAIDLGIAPTWTALHTFSAGVDVTGTLAVTGDITATGAVSGSNLSAAGGADPSASLGLAAVDGSATTFMRSDAAPALSQAIAPTWTALHTFSAGLSATNVKVTGSTAPTNGIYLPSANTLGFAVNGGSTGSITASVLTVPAVAVSSSTVSANGIYLPATNELGFATNTTARGTISSAGAWTINTPSSGVVALTVNGPTSTSGAVQINSGYGAAVSVPDITVSRAGSTANTIQQGPNISLFDSSGTTESVLQHSGGQTELWQFNGGSWKQIFAVSSGGRMDFGNNYSTDVGIGFATPSTATPVSFSFKTSSSATYCIFAAGSTGTTTVGSITTTGSATAYNTSSDIRLKKNIVDAAAAGQIIDQIRVRSFDWKHCDAHTAFGMVAQELSAVYPDAVTEGDVWAIDNSKLVPLLVKEVQSLRSRMAALEPGVR